jgi:hypothetical protein
MKLLVLFVGTLFFSGVASAEKGELWETKLVIVSKQQGRMDMPSQRICQKKKSNEQINPSDFMPKLAKQCGQASTRQNGNTIRWKMACEQGESTGLIRLINSENYDGEMETKTPDGIFKMEFKAKKIGESCMLSDSE